MSPFVLRHASGQMLAGLDEGGDPVLTWDPAQAFIFDSSVAASEVAYAMGFPNSLRAMCLAWASAFAAGQAA